MAGMPEVAPQQTLFALAGGKTDVGRKRDHNEDQVLINEELGLYAVADGMGGHQAGDVASSIAAASLGQIHTQLASLGGGGIYPTGHCQKPPRTNERASPPGASAFKYAYFFARPKVTPVPLPGGAVALF